MLIRRIHRAKFERAKLVHPELTPTSYSILNALAEVGSQRSTDLADMFAIDKGAVSRQVQILEDLDLIERTPDPDDGRAARLSLTEVGLQRMHAVIEQRRIRFEDRLSDWTTPEVDELVGLLARYNRSLS
ncbi:MAG: MarR family transcriptional regulator [Actinomycetota bacterium]|nr:MarR family transcriptional regulator [Actinomycetota bacterium]